MINEERDWWYISAGEPDDSVPLTLIHLVSTFEEAMEIAVPFHSKTGLKTKIHKTNRNLFSSFEEAKEALLDRFRSRINLCINSIEECKEAIAQIESMSEDDFQTNQSKEWDDQFYYEEE